MELLHHQPMLREEDGQYVCSRCELVNPPNDVPCVPVDTNPVIEQQASKSRVCD